MKVRTHSIPIRELSNGHIISLEVWHLESEHPGPTVYIQAGLHAGELQGIGVIYALRSLLSKQAFCGKIILVPTANPYALSIKMGEYTYGRFDPTTGENWNRSFWNAVDVTDPNALNIKEFVDETRNLSQTNQRKAFKNSLQKALAKRKERISANASFSQILSLNLQLLAVEADIVLDLHCDSKSHPYLFAPSYAKNEAPYLLNQFHILTERAFTPDFNQACFIPWWELAVALNEPTPSFFSYTLELGSKDTFSLENSKEMASKIVNYLTYKGVIDGNAQMPSKPIYECMVSDYKYIRSPHGGLVEFTASLGEILPSGKVYAHLQRIGQAESYLSPISLSLPYDAIPLTHTSCANVHSQDELMKVMTNVQLKNNAKAPQND